MDQSSSTLPSLLAIGIVVVMFLVYHVIFHDPVT